MDILGLHNGTIISTLVVPRAGCDVGRGGCG